MNRLATGTNPDGTSRAVYICSYQYFALCIRTSAPASLARLRMPRKSPWLLVVQHCLASTSSSIRCPLSCCSFCPYPRSHVAMSCGAIFWRTHGSNSSMRDKPRKFVWKITQTPSTLLLGLPVPQLTYRSKYILVSSVLLVKKLEPVREFPKIDENTSASICLRTSPPSVSRGAI